MKLLDSQAGLAAGLAELKRLDPAMARLAESGVHPPLRKREPGFAGLASIIVAQQVSTASAAAIVGRLTALLGEVTPDAFMRRTDSELLAAGLSRAKLKTLRAISAALHGDPAMLSGLSEKAAEDAHASLTALHGVGPWTADIYLLFCLGHPDIFPSGDLALQEAARVLLALPSRPSSKALAAIAAERWAPWRGVAALMLWAYYRRLRSREGAPP